MEFIDETWVDETWGQFIIIDIEEENKYKIIYKENNNNIKKMDRIDEEWNNENLTMVWGKQTIKDIIRDVCNTSWVIYINLTNSP